MTINSINGVSSAQRPSALDQYSNYLNQQPMASQQSSQASPGQQMWSMLLANMLGAGQQNNPDASTLGQNMPASSAGAAAGNNLQMGLISSAIELFTALLPLLRALSGNGNGNGTGMQSNSDAGGLADKFGGGSPGPSLFGRQPNPSVESNSSPTTGAPSKISPTSSDKPTSSDNSTTSEKPSSSDKSTTPDKPVSGAGKPTEIPPATGTVEVNKTIVVKAGETFDGGGKLYQAGKALGNGDQSENQQAVFVIEQGGTLKNVQVAGGDGVHTKGDATLKDVWWKDVGEDAMTMKGAGNVKVSGGGAYAASDKIFQINAGGSLSIDGFTADGFGKAVRTNGGKDFPIEIDITNSVFRNGKEAVIRTDAVKGAQINWDNASNTVDQVPNVVLAPRSARVNGLDSWESKAYTG